MTRPTRRRVLACGLCFSATWLTRRVLIAGVGAAGATGPAAAAQGLSDFTTSSGAPSCNGARKPTPATREEFYKANAPERTWLRTPDVTGTPLRVSGAVIGLRCGAIKDARVEFWQADEHGQYDLTGFRLRGQQRSTAKGEFQVETIVPGAAPGRAERLHVRVTPPDHAALSTEWFFSDDPTRATDQSYRPDLLLKAVPGASGHAVTFDVVFDL
jgi:protocatechuate 3,4-dioxygenase beta subunit